MANRPIQELLKELKLVFNEIMAICPKFAGSHKVVFVASEHNVHYLKDGKVLLKFRCPKKCPKTIRGLNSCIEYKDNDCTEQELEVLIDWLGTPYDTTTSWSNYKMLADSLIMNAAHLSDIAAQVSEALKKELPPDML